MEGFRGIECYFKNPETGQEGWEIEFIDMDGKDQDDVAAKIQALPNFDCFIDIYFDKYN